MANDAPSLFERLKQRRVFRVGGVYLVTAWVLLQVGSVVFGPLGLPPWSELALIVLLALGFPMALVLAWTYDITPDGIAKTSDAPPTTDMSASIAVLPFVAMGEQAGLKTLGEGLAEEITNQIVDRRECQVASRTSAFAQAQSGTDVNAIGRALGVWYVLEGSVRPIGERIRLTTQLVRVHDGFHLWSATYDLPSQGEHRELDRVSITVSALTSHYIGSDLRVQAARQLTRNAEAFRHFEAAVRLRVRLNTGGLTEPTGAVGKQIVGELDRAIALDPNFVAPYRLRANLYANRLGGSVRWQDAAREARRSVERALELQPEDPDGLGELALLQWSIELDPTAAEQTIERIGRIDPKRSMEQTLGSIASTRGRVREATQHFRQAAERRSADAVNHIELGWLLLEQDDLAAAKRAFDAALFVTPKGSMAVMATWGLIDVALRQDDSMGAETLFEQLWSEYRFAFPERFGYLLARMGRSNEARALLEELIREPTPNSEWIFWTYYGLMEYDQALVWLLQAIDDHRTRVIMRVRRPNAFPGLQNLPGYATALARLDAVQRSP